MKTELAQKAVPAQHISQHFVGLTTEQVEESRRTHGANLLTPPERDPWWKQYLEKFEDPIIRILLVAAVISLVIGIHEGEFVESIGIFIAILLATGIGFWNELKAMKAFDILNKQNDDLAYKVIRNGSPGTVQKRDIVVGDQIIIEAGEKFPADASVLEAVNFTVDEASLTGESVPVNKFASSNVTEPMREKAAYPPDKVLRGTVAKDGRGVIAFTAVGDRTEIGQTFKEVFKMETEET